MNKIISLILTLALCLSLCACGGMSKDEMVSAAKEFDIEDLKDAMEKNKLAAQEKWEGEVYAISAFVDEIESGKCRLVFFTDPNAGSASYYVIAPFDKETLLSLTVGERINLVGRIKKVQNHQIVLDSAYYIDGQTELSVKICSIVYASASDNLPKYSTVIIQGFLDGQVVPYCNVYMDGEVLTKLNEDDEIVVKGKLSLLGDAHNIYKYYNEIVGLEMKGAVPVN